MKKYKLTDQTLKAYNGYQWKLNFPVTTDGNSDKLCNKHWLHYYHHPELAVLLNPLYTNIHNPRLFEIKALGKHLNDRGLKGGCTKIILIQELEIPIITLNQKIAFAILCAMKVCHDPNFIIWANKWLDNSDRTYAAVYATYATDATYAAIYATYAAAYAANAANAAYAAAYSAAYAANAARFNLIRIAKKALKYY